jgi:CDP-diacylglycerol--glycerol-3-phosphate 3-phosphatidyltransferase
MRYSVPNLLTYFRILLIPVVVAAFYMDGRMAHWAAAALFAAASITDYLDGFLARAWKQESSLGRFLDPIADKLLVAAVIIMLVHFRRADVIPGILIVCREMLVSGLREFLAEIQVRVSVSKLAKVKTAVQMLAIFLLLLGSKGSGLPFVDTLGRVSLWLAAALTIITGYAYLRAGLKHMD